MRVYEALARELSRHGVSVVFGLLGDETVRLGAELCSLGITFYRSRHENQAVTMAHGYAQSSGRLGVAIVSRGPGFTNALTAMAAAAKSRSHVLVISGETGSGSEVSSREGRADWKYVDHASLCGLVGMRQVRTQSAESAVSSLRAALKHAETLGAVAFTVPSQAMDAEAEQIDSADEVTVSVAVAASSQDEINLVADLLCTSWAASRPMILAGRGAVASSAGLVLRRLGELTGSILATTMQARSLFSGDPYAIGVCGASSTAIGAELIGSSDCVLVFGATLNDDTTYKRTLFRGARIVQVDNDVDALGVFLEPDMGIVGDAAEVASALVDELERRGHHAIGYRTPELRRQIVDHDERASVVDESREGAVDPRSLTIELDKLLPWPRTVVLDAGHFMVWSFAFLNVGQPADFIQPNSNWYSIGLGMGAAVGAAVARPDVTTVLGIGDTGMMMALGDLETAIRERLPILVVVHNDGAWGSEVRILRMRGMPDSVARVPTPSFAAIARAMGGEGLTITSILDLQAASDQLHRVGSGPLLLDCLINADVP